MAALAAGCGRSAAPPPPPAPADSARSAAPAAPAPSASPPPLPAGVTVAAGWSLRLLGPGLGGPDDLLALPDGTLYFSDIRSGEVGALAPGAAAPAVVASGLRVPEGLVRLEDGTLLVVEQGRNRIVRLVPETGRWEPWMTLDNPTALEGVDGIALTPGGLLIPDSPLGRLLLQPIAGTAPQGQPRVLAGAGMTRPTSAAPGPDGTIYIADETGGALEALAPGASRPARLVGLPSPDDVSLVPGGALLVGCLDGTVRAVDPASRTVTTVIAGLGSPQGLTADGGGWAVADESANRIFLLQRA